jgi:hypothetical protein
VFGRWHSRRLQLGGRSTCSIFSVCQRRLLVFPLSLLAYTSNET